MHLSQGLHRGQFKSILKICKFKINLSRATKFKMKLNQYNLSKVKNHYFLKKQVKNLKTFLKILKK